MYHQAWKPSETESHRRLPSRQLPAVSARPHRVHGLPFSRRTTWRFVLLCGFGLFLFTGCAGEGERYAAAPDAEFEADGSAAASRFESVDSAIADASADQTVDSADSNSSGMPISPAPGDSPNAAPPEMAPANEASPANNRETLEPRKRTRSTLDGPPPLELSPSPDEMTSEVDDGGGELAMAAPALADRSPRHENHGEHHAEGLNAPSTNATRTSDEESAQSVQVLFATDRLPTSEVLPSMVRTFLPAMGVACICWAMFIGLALAKRFQTFWIIGAGMATCLGMMVLHTCIVRWQGYSRLASNGATRFSVLRYEPEANQYPLHLGLAEVSIPKIHKKGQLEAPSLFRLEFSEDAKKHVVLQKVTVEESADDWFGKLTDQVRYAEDREGFVFVHGFNVRFGDALKRTAQLATDLEVDGPIISYSWPSRGQISAYSADEASVSWAAPNFERLLVDIATQSEVRKINIVAHSMGNRALLEAFERIHLRTGSGDVAVKPKMIGSVILAAPDVDALKFRKRYLSAIANVAERSTVYFTREDLALRLSTSLHAAARLGLGGLPPGQMLEAVDAGKQGLFSLGHSYYGSDPAIIDDMKQVLNSGTRAAEREYLSEAMTENGATYFTLDRSLHARRANGSAVR